jgi:hypothetical protein
MIKAILPKTNGSQVRVELQVDDAYTASFYAHHFEVKMEPAVNQFQICLQNDLDLTLGFIWCDAIQEAKDKTDGR